MADTASIHFTYSLWLAIYPLSLLLLAFLFRWQSRALLPWHSLLPLWSRRRYRHPLQHLLAAMNRTTLADDNRRFHWQEFLLYAVLLGLLQLALAQPYRIGAKIPEPPPQRDAAFIVDTSVSMLLRDYLVDGQRTDRMTMLKGVLDYFITRLSGNRLAVMVFSEEAYTLVPLTNDYALLRHQMQRLEPAVLTGRTTDLSKALLYAGHEYASGSTEKPALILITDASRPHRDIDPRAVAKHLAASGFRLHVIAMGAASYDAQERDAYTLVYHPANFKLLEDIASAGQGRFFWAKSTTELNRALQEIQQTEQRIPDATAEFVHLPLYHWPLLAALLWLTLWQLLPLARRTARGERT